MQKRVDIYTHPDDSSCHEVMQFLRTQEFDLRVRDLSDRPLTSVEISLLIKHFDTKHFINTASKAFKKHHLDKMMPTRQELIQMLAADNELLRMPIIVSGRLMTVGCNRQKIMEMLQIKSNGSGPGENTARTENGSRGSRS